MTSPCNHCAQQIPMNVCTAYSQDLGIYFNPAKSHLITLGGGSPHGATLY